MSHEAIWCSNLSRQRVASCVSAFKDVTKRGKVYWVAIYMYNVVTFSVHLFYTKQTHGEMEFSFFRNRILASGS